MATESARDLLVDTDNILMKDTHRQVFYVARQRLSLKGHWLPSYIKNISLEEFFSQYGQVESVKGDKGYIQDDKMMSDGTRTITLFTDEIKNYDIPHLVRFGFGVTM